MEKSNNQSLNNQGHSKYNHFKAQGERIFNAFYGRPLTMLQVAKLTDIERANICRRVAELRDENSIYLVRKGLCPITHHRAGFYTTDRSVYLECLKKQGND